MKKILRFFTFLSSIILICANSLLVSGCSIFFHKFNRNDNVSMLQYNIPGEHDFILKYETAIANKASNNSINEFNQLYDSNKSKLLWQNYESLQNDLLTTKMGNYYCDDNWDQLFDLEGLNYQEKKVAESNILRLYNIIGILYGYDVVIKLIQTIIKITQTNNVIAWANYNKIHNNLQIGFDSECFDTNFIDQEYQKGWWASNNIISVICHEVGYAIGIYLTLNDEQRKTFNNDWNVNNNNEKYNLLTSTNKINKLAAHSQKQITDYVENFMDYINKISKAVITNKKENILLSLIVVRSNFGRGAWINFDMNIPKSALFAEAFNEWILTPEKDKNWNWELLNDFFMNYLPHWI